MTRAATRRAALIFALATPALALSGCETTAQKSAGLEKIALRSKRAAQTGLTIKHPSAVVKVLSGEIVKGSEGTAVVLTLRNGSANALADVPIAVSLKNARGTSIYSNATPGLARTLTSIALLPAHATATWIDDQIQSSDAASVTSEVGEGTVVGGAVPKLAVREARLSEGSAEGRLVNSSPATQPELVIYALARRGGHIVGAGRAVIASLAAGASSPFQAFFIGDTSGAHLQLSVPPTRVG